jgi:hypothetical protein
MKLTEGLRENDLEGLVLPVISIDQFESKIDDDAIVIGFYVLYRDPATDLNRFIQKSAVDIIDTEVSPAPTEEGYYVVFVEVMRNEKFPEALLAILENIGNLVGFSNWQFTAYGVDGVHDLSVDEIKSLIRLTPAVESDTNDSDIGESVDRHTIDRILDEGRRDPSYSLPTTMAEFRDAIQKLFAS